MNWFKDKLVSMFSADENSETDQHSRVHHDQNQSYEKSVNAKITYQYPKGNFRFPLIPDEDVQKDTMAMETQKEAPKMSGQRQKTKLNKIGKDKRFFQPTKVPSPIYGFKERKREELKKQEIVEYELPRSSDPIDIDVPAPLQILVNDVPYKGFIMETEQDEIEQSNTEIDLEKKSADLTDCMDSFEPTTNNLDSDMQEKLILNDSDLEINTTEKKQMSESNVDLKASELEAANSKDDHEQAHSNDQKNQSFVPYNVMMLKQDKRKQPFPMEEKVMKEGSYTFPSEKLLKDPPNGHNQDDEWIQAQQQLLNETLENFNVRASVVNVTQGPAVTRFEVHPEPGVKVNKITNLVDDIKLSLAAKDIRIEAPIPGKNTIGIEVPNRFSKPVMLKEVIFSSIFQKSASPLTVALGFDIAGKPVVTDLKKMPHGLIAGATGSGKSVCINAMLISLLYKASPNQVKLMLIDPKVVELAPYNNIPHLVSPVITDVKAATQALKWAVEEMERRYELFATAGVRDISRYNEMVKLHEEPSGELPYLVIVIDELADLMMMAPSDVEEAICRIAQKARACGIHLIIATQRPSVDVITGLIKANIPTRIAFSVSSQIDSRTIIDMSGAERLLGKGDMLFWENGSSKPFRVQGNFVSDDEIEQVVDHVKSEMEPNYFFEQQDLIKKESTSTEEDELFYEACEFIINQGGASTSSLQRNFRIGYNRAARLIESMEEQGIISEAHGSKPRDVLISEEELLSIQETN